MKTFRVHATDPETGEDTVFDVHAKSWTSDANGVHFVQEDGEVATYMTEHWQWIEEPLLPDDKL